MGKGLVYRCPVCSFQKEYPVGCGFMSPLEAATERENILAGIYGPKPKTAIVAHPEAPVEVEHALFQCRSLWKAGKPLGRHDKGRCSGSNSPAV